MTPPGEDKREDLLGGRPESRRPAWLERVLAARRHRVGRVAGPVVLVLLLALVVVPRLPLSASGTGRGTGLDGSSAPPVDAAADVTTRWPLRGDLAGDNAFTKAAMRRLRADRPRAARALFAGHLPDGSRVLLATNSARPGGATINVALLHIAAGRAVAAGTATDVATLTDPAAALAWAVAGRDGSVSALVLGPPRGLRVELSGRVDFDARGTPTRQWQVRSARRGVVVADLGRGTDPAVAVRSPGGVTPFATPELIAVDGRTVTPAADLRVTGVRAPAYRGPEGALLTQALVAQTQSLLDLGGTRLKVVWSGVPWRSRRMALVLVTTPSGRRLEALVGELDGDWYPAGLRALPDGATERLPWLLEPSSSADPTQLLCPTGSGSLDYLRPGLPVARVPITDDGVATLLEPGNSPVRAGGAKVVLRDLSGRAVLRTRLPSTGFDDPFALDET